VLAIPYIGWDLRMNILLSASFWELMKTKEILLKRWLFSGLVSEYYAKM
jgi:hypothetical protein